MRPGRFRQARLPQKNSLRKFNDLRRQRLQSLLARAILHADTLHCTLNGLRTACLCGP